ncbi:MAG: DUF898 family protein [Bacilli bacterium]|nr:DUF898 family protein [Bacilli bacterium]
MEENKTNMTDLDAEKAKKTELLNELDKLMFNTTEEENVETKVQNTVEEVVETKTVEVKEETKVQETSKGPEKKAESVEQNNSRISYFWGKLLDLYGWNYLKYVLTFATATLGAPWGKCLQLKYELGHTVLGGKKLRFDADGSELFVEQFKWNFLTGITFGIYGLWVPIKKKKWIVSHIGFEDEKIDPSKSYFTGTMLRLLGINLLCLLVILISFGLLFPVAECIKLRWLAKNTVINGHRVIFEGKALKLYGKYIKWALLMVVTFGIYGFWVPLRKLEWEVENTALLN